MKRYAMETSVGVFVVMGIICVGYMAVNLGNVSIFSDDTYRLSARFTSVSGLRKGSPVEVHGIQAGIVEDLTFDPESDMAVVVVKIQKHVTIYDDGSAAIKTSGLIGDKYVNIEPGGSGEPLKPDGWITETTAPVDIEDLIGKYAFGDVNKKGSGK